MTAPAGGGGWDLEQFAPHRLLEFLDLDEDVTEPRIHRTVDAAVLVADVVGFTSQTEALARHGAEGAEELARELDAALGPLIEEVRRGGGDVLELVGDAVVAAFEVTPDRPLPASAIRRAVEAVEAVGPDARAGDRLPLHCGIGFGALSYALLPGTPSRRAYLAVGPPIVEANRACKRSEPGTIVLGPEAEYLTRDAIDGDPPVDGYRTVESLRAPLPAVRLRELPSVDPNVLATFLPRAVRDGLDAGSAGFLAEFRRVSVLFARVEGVGVQGAGAVERLNHLWTVAQEELEPLDGALDKLVADDHGVVLMAVWGMPFNEHEDSAVRAMTGAMALHARLTAMEVTCSVGVATGQAWAGAYGGVRRRAYTVLGSPVNRAARLAEAARRSVLADDETTQQARRRIEVESFPAITVKGFEGPLDAYRPRVVRPLDEMLQGRSDLVGRAAELGFVDDAMGRLESDGLGGRILLDGEPGIGKSALLQAIVYGARRRGIPVLGGTGDPITRATAYRPWRPVIAGVLGLDRPGATVLSASGRPEPKQVARLERLLHEHPDADRVRSWLPVLEDILPLGLAPSDAVAQMEDQPRAEALREIVVGLLRGATVQGPRVLALDDLQWFDSPSLALVRAVAEGVPRLLLVATARSEGTPGQDGPALAAMLGCTRLRLPLLSRHETGRVAAQALGVESLPESVRLTIQAESAGNPLYAEELARALLEGGVVEVVDGVAKVGPEQPDAEGVSHPPTLQGVIAGRIGSLAPAQQRVLKVASVVGRQFDLTILRAVHPVSEERDELVGLVRGLVSTGLAQVVGDPLAEEFRFRHALIQDQAYELMLPGQRRRLHLAIARWYEAASSGDAPALPLLAWHYVRAGEPAQAVEYLAKAGAQAMERYANEEAVALLEEALDLDPEAGGGRSNRRARWAAWIAEADHRPARWADLRSGARRVLTWLGRSEPRTLPGLLVSTVGAVLVQIGHLLTPGSLALPGDRAEARRIAANAYQNLAELYYRQTETVRLTHAVVSALNAAERAGDCRELPAAYGAAGVVAGMMGLPTLAGRYHRKGLEVAERLGHEPTLAYSIQLELAYGAATGRWDVVERCRARPEESFRRLGDSYRVGINLSLVGFSALHRGAFAEAERALLELWRLASPRRQHENMLLAATGLLACSLETLNDLIQRMQWVRDVLAEEETTALNEILARGLLALGEELLDRPGEADVEAAAAAKLLRRSPPTTYYCLTGVAALIRLHLGRWHAAADEAEAARAERAVRLPLSRLHLLALVNGVATVRYRLMTAEVAVLRGRAGAARRRFASVRSLAARRGFSLDEALAGAGQALLTGDEDGLQAARTSFEELGALVPLGRLERILDRPSAQPA